MLKKFLPKQNGFFEHFQKTADLIVIATHQFHEMMKNLHQQQDYVDKIASLEEEADKIAHRTFELLHKTFITPFDRHDIHSLTSSLDDILDLLNRCAQRFPFYDLKNVPHEIIHLSELCEQAGEQLKEAVYRLHSLKKADEIFHFCNQLDHIEREAHQAVLSGEKNLFLHENHFKQFFKLKEIYAKTKLVINSCQDCGNIIKGIILEYS